MKTITMGDYQVAAQAKYVGEGVVEVTVTCSGVSQTGKHNFQGKHFHTAEHFDKSINDFASRLAEELTGRIRSRELASNFAKRQE